MKKRLPYFRLPDKGFKVVKPYKCFISSYPGPIKKRKVKCIKKWEYEKYQVN
jgi:hypothetical protein